MFKKLSIKVRLLLAITGIICIAVVPISIIVYGVSKNQIENTVAEKFKILNRLKLNEVESFVDQLEGSVSEVQHSKVIGEHLPQYILMKNVKNDSLNRKAVSRKIVLDELHKMKEAKYVNNIALFNEDSEYEFVTGHIDFSEKNTRFIQSEIDKSILNKTAKVRYSNVEKTNISSQHQEYTFLAFAPIKMSKIDKSMFVVFEYELNSLFKSINDTAHLGVSGEVLITRKQGNYVQILNPLRHKDVFAYDTIALGNKKGVPAQNSVMEDPGYGIYTDYRGKQVLAKWTFMPEVEWGLVTKIDENEALASIVNLKGIILVLCVVSLVIVVIVTTIFSDNFLRPILMVRNNMISLANGKFPSNIEYDGEDEIKQTSTAINTLVTRLQKSTKFAEAIGSGELKTKIDMNDKSDVLARSLMVMRDNLIKNSEENEKREWASEGVASVSEILRKHADIESMGKELITYLSEYMDVQMGLLYVLKKGKDNVLSLLSSFAYEGEKKKLIEFGQSLVGQAALEKKPIKITEPPEGYSKISSSLGSTLPVEILIVPLKINEKVYGVIEIASITTIEAYKVEFLERIGESVASVIFADRS